MRIVNFQFYKVKAGMAGWANSLPSYDGTGLFIRKLLGRIFLSRQWWRKVKWHLWLHVICG